VSRTLHPVDRSLTSPLRITVPAVVRVDGPAIACSPTVFHRVTNAVLVNVY
jgi:hypothetical protein